MNEKETEEVTSGDQQGTALQTHQHSRRNVKLNSAYIWFVVNNPKSIYISLRNYSIPYIFENVGGEEQSSCYLLRVGSWTLDSIVDVKEFSLKRKKYFNI